MMKGLGVIITAVCFSMPLQAGVIPLEERERGWFWYEIEPEEEEPIDEPLVTPLVLPTPAPQEPEQEAPPPIMSTAWLRENIPTALDRAIDDPTDDNVAVYAYLQRAAFDKSEKFANKFQQVVLSDPLLDENNRVPISTMGQRLNRRDRAAQDDAVLKWLSSRVGFFYFHDDTCRYCSDQLPILERLAEQHDLSFMTIGVGGSAIGNSVFPARMNDGHAERFKVSRVPSIVMVWPENNAAVLSQGFVTQGGLASRIVLMASEMDVLDDEIKAELSIAEPEFVTDTDLQLSDDVDLVEWVNELRREMGYE